MVQARTRTVRKSGSTAIPGTYNVTITPQPAGAEDLQVWFDARGFAIKSSTDISKTEYTITISHPPTDSKQVVTFTVTPMGRIKQGGAT